MTARAVRLPRARRGAWLRPVRLGLVALATLAVAYAAVSVKVAEEITHARRVAPPAAPSIAAPFENVAFRTVDGLTLRGWFLPGRGDRAVVVAHGKGTNRTEGTRVGEFLVAAGYGVLLFDLRGHGASEGDRFSLGQYERWDVAAAVEHLAGRGVPERLVGLVGISMGAGTVLQAVAVRPNVGPVVADSAYVDGRTIVWETGHQESGLPTWFNPGLVFASRTLFGLDVDQVDPRAVVRAHPERPFLFIQCDGDGVVFAHNGRDLRAASANAASELWLATRCGHVQALTAYPAEYQRRVLAFLDANMK